MDYIKKLLFTGISVPKEFRFISVWLTLFFSFPYFIRKVDPTAAAIDPGALSAVVMTVFTLLLFKACTWWLIRHIWPAFAIYANYHFQTVYKLLPEWQKITLFLGFYVLLLYAFIFILHAIV
ncbi:MAG: hypothetical protein EOO99_11655 [Pedobacter sp.]|nr:MAG: hypothetical protein EOO99_11655 [Pedobacter sp.]